MSYEPEFMQAYNDLLASLENSKLFQKHPKYRTALSAIVEPERVIQFRVIWEDDNGCFRMNRDYRLIYNSALGACKVGMRFHPSVNLSVLKFLGRSRVFKNALAGLGLGGAKGGSDFDPKDKSDSEIQRFCQAFMTKLKDYISVYSDIPGGDIGVSEREIGWLAGQYKMLQNSFECVITGKGGKESPCAEQLNRTEPLLDVARCCC